MPPASFAAAAAGLVLAGQWALDGSGSVAVPGTSAWWW